MNEPSKDGAKQAKSDIPVLEWIAAAIGLLLTLGLLGVIGREALTGNGEQPPAIEAMVKQVTPAGGGYVVEVVLRNRSSSTAAAVEIEGELKSGDRTVETSSATLDYVPGEASRDAGLFFTEDPNRHQLQVRALGYARP